MSSIAEHLKSVSQRIQKATKNAGREADSVTLLGVSKTRSSEEVKQAFDAGLRAFGENYLQDAETKIKALTDLPIQWHFIGPLQSNKTRPVAELFDWVHTVDRLKIARRLNDQRPAEAAPLNVCLQVNISGEESKSGVPLSEVDALASAVSELPRLCLRGLMTIPAASEDEAKLRDHFRAMRDTLAQLQKSFPTMDTLSMGMSGDLDIAIEEGSTLVRVGTAIFGPRPPKTTTGA